MEIIEHEGRRISLEVADRGKGWTWTFQIDSGPVIANSGEPHPTEALARLEAVAVAEREIDRRRFAESFPSPPDVAEASVGQAGAAASSQITR